MGEALLGLKPREVWKHFYALTRIPRPSGHEEKIRAFVAGFGEDLGLRTLVDRAGNVIIRKPAAKGMENAAGVILQAHLDMVPQKKGGIEHDFENDPVETVIDAGSVRACGTTLGADNGIGVAAILAVLESTVLRHGPLEALLTSNEENGMTGAFGLKPGLLRGRVLLNLDSEEEGELFIGCAGGIDGTMTFGYDTRSLPEGYEGFVVRVEGLKGGHSGMDIHLGRGNANKIMNRLLLDGAAYHRLRLASIDGGSLRNAIPRESTAVVAVPKAGAEGFMREFSALAGSIHRELASAEPSLHITATPAGRPETVVEERVAANLFEAVRACPNGVLRMSDEMPDLVETSNNLARVVSTGSSARVECLLRSSVDSARENLCRAIEKVFVPAGAVPVFHGGYPGWKPDPASPVLGIMRDIYRARFGRTPGVKAVHAGLECGIIGATYPGLDMISFGPTIRNPHSPDETVDIASVGRFWDFLTGVLGGMPAGAR